MGIFSGFWDDIKEGFEDAGEYVFGFSEMLFGGAALIYTGVKITGAESVFAALPAIALATGSALVVLDGLERTWLWQWQEQYQVGWTSIFTELLPAVAEMGGGAYLVYRGANGLWSAEEAFTYRGVGFGVGALSAAAGAFLMYDGYNRFQTGHGVVWTDVIEEKEDPYLKGKKYDEVRFDYKYNFGHEQGTTFGADASQLKERCLTNKSYFYDEEDQKCITEATRSNYELVRRAEINEKTTAERAAQGQRQDGSFISSYLDNEDFWNKQVKDMTCQDWIIYNNPGYFLNTNRESRDTSSDDLEKVRFLQNSAPEDCLDAVRRGKSLDFKPSSNALSAYLKEHFSVDSYDGNFVSLANITRNEQVGPSSHDPESGDGDIEDWHPPKYDNTDDYHSTTTRDVPTYSNSTSSYKRDMNRYANKGRKRVAGGKKSTV